MRDWPPLHDYRRSQAVVMGTWDYTHLPSIPAAENSLTRMTDLLTSPLCGWPRDRVQVLANERSPGDLPYRLVTTFEEVVDVALFYYVGHGQIDQEDQLCLGLTETRTEPNRRAVTSLPFQSVRRALLDCAAAIKIVILDCCFSGLASNPANTLAGSDDRVLDLVAGVGSYTIAASGSFGTAWFETDSESELPQTIFTKYLADLVEAGIPGEGPWLRLHRIYNQLRENLARDRRPIPQARSVDSARDFIFAHNAASGVTLQDPILAPAAARPLAEVCSDAPSGTDMIGASEDVEILADLIAAADTSPPLTIALIGDWGAGKSSVMLQIQRRVDLLADISRSNAGPSAFAANVRQVRFNAWDYSDDQLWCGLVDHLFSALATDLGDTSYLSDPTAVQTERAALHRELAEHETKEQRLDNALRTADRVAQPEGFLARLGSPAYAWRIIRAVSHELFYDIRSATFILLGWAVLGFAAYEAWWHWGPFIGTVTATAAAVLAPAAAMAQRLRHWHQESLDITTRLRRRLDQQQRKVSQRIADLRERLALIDASVRLSAFLTNRASPQAYQKHRGLIGEVRGDLARLAEDLACARNEWIAAGSSTPPPLERIVLYIDDLDRCPPRRVVEVLEAIHLMLAFELFVVVVAVDARWLIRSLEYHYHELFSTGTTSETTPASMSETDIYSGSASPADYLDKIFQIPFVLAPPSSPALALYLQSLLSSASSETNSQSSTEGSSRGDESDYLASGKKAMRARSENSRHVNGQIDEPDTGAPELRPQRLQFSKREVEFIGRLSPLLPTPRAAKRLVNLYRLVRIGIPNSDRASYTGSDSGGPYQAVQILLAMMVGRPAVAQRIFAEVMCAPADSDILTVLEKASSSEFAEAHLCESIAADLVRITRSTPLLVAIEEYQHWCPILARYSFHTRTTTAGQPAEAQPPKSTE